MDSWFLMVMKWREYLVLRLLICDDAKVVEVLPGLLVCDDDEVDGVPGPWTLGL